MPETFDPKKTSLIVAGHYVTGYMDGTMISASKNEDTRIPHVGAQGDVTISKSADATGTITVQLKQTSPSLPYFLELAERDDFFPAQVIDANNNKLKAGGEECTILKKPDIEWGAEVAGVEVSIYVCDYDLKQ